MARPPTSKDKQRRAAVVLAQTGNASAAGRAVGVSGVTVGRWHRDNPEFRSTLLEAKARVRETSETIHELAAAELERRLGDIDTVKQWENSDLLRAAAVTAKLITETPDPPEKRGGPGWDSEDEALKAMAGAMTEEQFEKLRKFREK